MAGRSQRLVERVQWRLRAAGASYGSASLARREVAELKARVQTLRALGDPFHDVDLSKDIACGDAIKVSGGVGGVCVATEV